MKKNTKFLVTIDTLVFIYSVTSFYFLMSFIKYDIVNMHNRNYAICIIFVFIFTTVMSIIWLCYRLTFIKSYNKFASTQYKGGKINVSSSVRLFIIIGGLVFGFIIKKMLKAM